MAKLFEGLVGTDAAVLKVLGRIADALESIDQTLKSQDDTSMRGKLEKSARPASRPIKGR